MLKRCFVAAGLAYGALGLFPRARATPARADYCAMCADCGGQWYCEGASEGEAACAVYPDAHGGQYCFLSGICS